MPTSVAAIAWAQSALVSVSLNEPPKLPIALRTGAQMKISLLISSP